MNPIDRYARQRLIEWWDQNRLASARVLVAGAGALGNEVLKNLALLGIGHLLVVDFDHVEMSNLSRTVLFRESDAGRPKVEAAAESLGQMAPDTVVETICGDLFYDVGLGHYRHSDLVVGCLDSRAARAQVGQCCVLAGVPFLDGGMWSLGGEVRWFTPGDGPCFDCTLNADDRAHADERRSCSGFQNPDWVESGRMPTVISTAAVIGGMLAQEAAKYLCGHPVPSGKAIVYNGQALTLHQAELPRNPNCPLSHRPYENVIELDRSAFDLTPLELFGLVRKDGGERLKSGGPGAAEMVLELGRDFLAELDCPQCGSRQEINRVLGKVSEGERSCPVCHTIRTPVRLHSVDEKSIYGDRTLAELGVPPGEVLSLRMGIHLRQFELTRDLI